MERMDTLTPAGEVLATPAQPLRDSIRYVADDVSSLPEVAARLRGLADTYERMAVEGWTLASPVDEGLLYLVRRGD